MTMTATASARGGFDMGRVILRTLAAIRANLAVFAGLSAILSGLPAGLFSWAMYSLVRPLIFPAGPAASRRPTFDLSALPHFLGGGGLAWFVGMVLGLVLQASIVYGAVAYLNARPAGFGECLGAGLRRLPLLILLGLTMFVAELFGALLFIVPAVMMVMAWFVAIPVLVTEATGVFEALGRSGALTRGHRWAILGLSILYLVAYVIADRLLEAVVAAVGGLTGLVSPFVWGLMVGVPLAVASHVVTMTGIASVYYELRSIKEGIGPEALAAVFD